MAGTLDVLVVDDRPETVKLLTDFLAPRCRRVDAASSVKEAMTAITRRKTAGEKYHLIFSDFVMPGADGLTFLRELRQRHETIPFVFVTGYRALNPALESEAKRLGAIAILDKPIDLREVEKLIDHGTATFRRPQSQDSDQPFFGTSRTMRRSTEIAAAVPSQPSEALEPRPMRISDTHPPMPSPPQITAWQAPSEALERRGTGSFAPQPPASPPVAPPPGYQRQPSALIQVGSTTTRVRRSIDPTAPPVAGTGQISRLATPQPPTSFTARVRRGVEGTGSFRKPIQTESGRMVACTSCARSFLAQAKPEAYTTVCVHCGQLQRIDP